MDDRLLIDAAHRVAPIVRDRAGEADAARRIPAETIKELQSSGLFKVLQPKRYGGYEMDPRTYFEICSILGAADGSTGWVYGVLAGHSWIIALMSAAAQDAMWGADPDATASAAVFARQGGIEKLDDGTYKASGQWAFASGCHHGSWFLIGGVALNAMHEGLVFLLVPPGQFSIVDNWNVAGLCGTGSCDVVVDAVVPRERVLLHGDPLEVSSAPIYRLPLLSVLASVATYPLIGIAKGALDNYVSYQRSRMKLFGTMAGDEATTRYRAGVAAADIDAAEAVLARDWAEAIDTVRAGGELSDDQRIRMGRNQARAVDMSVQVVNRLFNASGARALWLDNPMQRAWRDINAGALHMTNQLDDKAITAGSYAFGVPADQLMF
ncbi:MAG: acyl-CoA dehydrogenase family protein [Acidimicrobiia bacterium]